MLIFHSTGAYYYSKANHEWWLIACVIRSGTAVCIPLFFMLSGMLLLDTEKGHEHIRTFFRKRFIKIAIPTLAWSILYMYYKKNINGQPFDIINSIKEIASGPAYFHLWFMYSIIGLYIATPILRIYACHENRNNLKYFIFLWILIVGIFPIANDFFGVKVGVQVAVTTGWSGYFIAGHYFRDTIISKKQTMYAVIIFIACLSWTVYMTNYFTFNVNSDFDDYFLKYRAPMIIVMSFISFILLKSINYEKLFGSSIFLINSMKYVSSTSFGIYLVHVLVLENFRNGTFGFKIHEINGTVVHPLIGISITFIATLSVSLLVVSILRKIPYVKVIVP